MTALTPGTRVRVIATDLTLAPAGTVTVLVEPVYGAALSIAVGDSAIVVDPADVEPIAVRP